jgi:hypothetical protein
VWVADERAELLGALTKAKTVFAALAKIVPSRPIGLARNHLAADVLNEMHDDRLRAMPMLDARVDCDGRLNRFPSQCSLR